MNAFASPSVPADVDATAWTTATPADLALALADLPAATRVLVEAGALDEDDLPD